VRELCSVVARLAGFLQPVLVDLQREIDLVVQNNEVSILSLSKEH
jgi:hypothetical protein